MLLWNSLEWVINGPNSNRLKIDFFLKKVAGALHCHWKLKLGSFLPVGNTMHTQHMRPTNFRTAPCWSPSQRKEKETANASRATAQVRIRPARLTFAWSGAVPRPGWGGWRREFFYFYIIFSIYQKYMSLYFFCKYVIQPPVHPAEGRYRQMNRR